MPDAPRDLRRAIEQLERDLDAFRKIQYASNQQTERRLRVLEGAAAPSLEATHTPSQQRAQWDAESLVNELEIAVAEHADGDYGGTADQWRRIGQARERLLAALRAPVGQQGEPDAWMEENLCGGEWRLWGVYTQRPAYKPENAHRRWVPLYRRVSEVQPTGSQGGSE